MNTLNESVHSTSIQIYWFLVFANLNSKVENAKQMKPELFANQQSDPYLVKELCKLMHRIERILVPAESTVYNPVVERLAKVQSKLQGGNFFQTVTEIDGIAVEKALVEKGAIRRVNWAVFEKELELAIFPDNPGSLPPLVKEEFDVEMNIHETKLEAIFKKERLRSIQVLVIPDINFIVILEPKQSTCHARTMEKGSICTTCL